MPTTYVALRASPRCQQLLMGADVFGVQRFSCKKCACTSYLCVIDTIPADELHERVPHHPRNSPEYTLCACGHHITDHRTESELASEGMPPAASADQPLEKCTICQSRAGACRCPLAGNLTHAVEASVTRAVRRRQPHEDGHLPWARAYCPKCFTKPNPRGCKKLNEDGHWTSVSLVAAKAAAGGGDDDAPSTDAADGPKVENDNARPS